MADVLAIVAPGQGAQTPGFLSPWLQLPTFAARIARLSEVVGVDLARMGSEADADTIRDTAVAQPLLVAAGVAVAAELSTTGEPTVSSPPVGLLAGHSVGELTAATLAGVLSPETAMTLVRERGKAMAEAATTRPTSMAAVVGGDPDEVRAAIEAAGLTPANNNGPGQVVAGGTVEQVEQLTANPPRRARVVPLSVAGAFHTVHMAPAVEHLRPLADAAEAQDPTVTLLSNADGQAVASGREYVGRLVSQIASPVRWDLCMETMAALGVTGLLELTPAGTLTGIAKRHLRTAELFTLNTPDQIDEARAFCDRHAGEPAPQPQEDPA